MTLRVLWSPTSFNLAIEILVVDRKDDSIYCGFSMLSFNLAIEILVVDRATIFSPVVVRV